MWHPENSIRHQLPDTRWPTAEQAPAPLLFSPIRVGRVTLESRTWVPAMVPWRATEEGFVTQNILDWYGRFAEGRPGVIVVEATGVRDIPSGPLLRIGHDRFVPGLAELVCRVKHASGGRTRLFIQLIDFLTIRRRPERDKFLRRFLTLTDHHSRELREAARNDEEVRDRLVAMSDEELERVLDGRELESLNFGYRERVTDVHLPHIRDLPQALPGVFADAARRAEAAGFDGVELHFAHAYTMASFLSATNSRNDGYGSSLHGRLRLPLEVYEAVRATVSKDFVVGCRYLADECVEGGNEVADAAAIGVAFAQAGMDFLSLSRGGKFDDAKQPPIGWAAYPYTGRSGWECMPTTLADPAGPFGRNVSSVRAIREAI